MSQELKERIDNWLMNDTGVYPHDASLLLIDLRTDMLVTDLKLLTAEAKLQRLLNELGALTQPDVNGNYNLITPKQINKLRAEYFEDKQ